MASAKFQHNLMNIQSNMLNFAYMLTSNRDDAYELLQSTTLKALVNEDKYTEGTDFKGWIFTIMRSTFANDFKSQPVDTSDSVYKLNLTRDSFVEVPVDCVEESRLTEILKDLDQTSRAVMSMHLVGYNYTEIAEYIGTTKHDVRVCIRNASRELSSRLSALA